MSKRESPAPPLNQPKDDATKDRTPTAPNSERVEHIVSAMTMAAGHYCQQHDGTMADMLSACFTMTHRAIEAVLYGQLNPPLNVREQFYMRKVITGGVERLWNLAAGGGAASKFEKQ